MFINIKNTINRYFPSFHSTKQNPLNLKSIQNKNLKYKYKIKKHKI